jgi:hypothetical protein
MTVPTGSNRARIFISYRREDSAGHAGRLYDRLVQRFGEDHVFKDLDSIKPGDVFAQVIAEAVESCDALLAVIGNSWLTITGQDGERRLDDPKDFVRLEIEAALKRGVRVIPVLVNGAQIPSVSELPPSLVPLVERQALDLSEKRFDYDVSQLLETLLTEVQPAPGAAGQSPERPADQPTGTAADRAAASKVSAWAERRTEEGRLLVAHNGSDESMYSCTLWLVTPRMRARAAGGLPPTDRRSAFTSIIRPGKDFRYLVRALKGPPPRKVPPVEIVFRDGQGQWWWRNQDGVLAELTSEQGINYSR